MQNRLIAKLALKKLKKTFRDIFGKQHTQECKVTKKEIARLQLNLDPRASFRCIKKTKNRFLIF